MTFGTTLLVWGLETLSITALLVLLAWFLERPLRHYPAVRRLMWGLVLCRLLAPPVMNWPEIAALTPARVKPVELVQPLPSEVPKLLPDVLVNASSVLPVDEIVPLPVASGSRDVEIPFAESPGSLSLLDNVVKPPRASSWRSVLHWSGWPGLLLSVWGAGSLLSIVRLALRLLRFQQRLHGSRPAPESLVSSSRDVARKLGLRPLPVQVIDGIDTPFVYCLRSPRLMWPTHLAKGMATHRLWGIIAHELAHVRQFDHWWQWVDLAARVVWWWNPLCWFARRRFWEASEQACDAVALSLGRIDRREYAEMFLELSTGPISNLPLPVLGWRGSHQAFQRRLTMMLTENVSQRTPWSVVVMLLLGGGLTLPAWTTAAKTALGDDQLSVEVALEPVATPATVDEAQSLVSDVSASPPSLDGIAIAVDGVTLQAAGDALILNQVDHSGTAAETIRTRNIVRAARAQPTRQQTILRLTAMYYTALADERAQDAEALKEALAALGASLPVPATTTVVRGRSPFGWSISAQPQPSASLRHFRGYSPFAVRLKITGAATGSVWGSGPYTDDSTMSAAAVHAGLVKVGESADIVVKLAGPGDRFTGCTRNGVTSADFSSWGGSYTLAPLAEMPEAPYLISKGPGGAYQTLSMLSDQVPLQPGISIVVPLEGKLTGSVWGDGIYTSDSNLEAAAVHSGALKGGEAAFVKVTLLPGQDQYGGGSKNGVESSTYGHYRMSYRMERMEHNAESHREPTPSIPTIESVR